jgi:hypothetical protein
VDWGLASKFLIGVGWGACPIPLKPFGARNDASKWVSLVMRSNLVSYSSSDSRDDRHKSTVTSYVYTLAGGTREQGKNSLTPQYAAYAPTLLLPSTRMVRNSLPTHMVHFH